MYLYDNQCTWTQIVILMRHQSVRLYVVQAKQRWKSAINLHVLSITHPVEK